MQNLYQVIFFTVIIYYYLFEESVLFGFGHGVDAANLFVSCIEEATQAKLPLIAAPPESGNTICIGRGPWSAALDPELVGLDEDGFVVAFPDARTMIIAGATDWGTEFGVYEALERYAGVRWLIPGPTGTDSDFPLAEKMHHKFMVLDGKLVRVVSWYDNEWGFSNRMVDTAGAMAAFL